MISKKQVRLNMFKENRNHLQEELFGFHNHLSERKLKGLQNSKEKAFYNIIYSNIEEKSFSVLYSEKKSRPNAPINTMVSALILKTHKGLTYKEMFEQIDYDLRMRTALGLSDFEKTPFSEPTIFDFQNRINAYGLETGINLFELVFDRLTKKQLEVLKVKTDIQRSDSFLAASNIRNYSRVQLLVEVILRFYRILSEEEKKNYKKLFSPYVKKTSHKFIYNLERNDIPKQLEKLGVISQKILNDFKDAYGDREIYKILERVFGEHYSLDKKRVKVKEAEELHSGILQSPDDLDATYRKKGTQKSKGQVINVTETAHPDNELNLIDDISIEKNNTSDSEILNFRIEIIKEKTPDLDELHTDGAYGSESNDKKMEQLEIAHIQTAVKGRKSEVEIEIEESDENYKVSCPSQQVTSEQTRKRNKANFDISICNDCSLKEICSTQIQKNQRVLYFTKEDHLKNKRRRAIAELPLERRKIRPNVEATVNEFRQAMNNKGKLKVRGKFKTEVYAYTMGIAINFGRIFRYIGKKKDFAWQIGVFATSIKIIFSKFNEMIHKVVFPAFSITFCEISKNQVTKSDSSNGILSLVIT